MITAIRRIQFCAGHRVYGHESKCANPHGHNYVAYFHARTLNSKLDLLGRIVDFSVLKEILGKWIDDNWDHGFIIYKEDTELYKALFKTERVTDDREMTWTETKHKLYILEDNPTAENMANHLLVMGNMLMSKYNIFINKVVLWETENCFVEAESEL